MTAPRSVKLEEDILLVLLEDDILKRVGHHGVYCLILSLRNRLALDAGRDLALAVSRDKIGNGLGVDSGCLGQRELELLLDLLDGERWPGRLREIEGLGMVGELHDPMAYVSLKLHFY